MTSWDCNGKLIQTLKYAQSTQSLQTVFFTHIYRKNVSKD
jgi:hypothetical protein